MPSTDITFCTSVTQDKKDCTLKEKCLRYVLYEQLRKAGAQPLYISMMNAPDNFKSCSVFFEITEKRDQA